MDFSRKLHEPFDYLEAKALVQICLEELGESENFIVVDQLAFEVRYGWAITAHPRSFLETGDEHSLVPGFGSFFADRVRRVAVPLSSSQPLDRAIESHCRQAGYEMD